MNLDILEKFSTYLRNTLSRSIDIAWELEMDSIPPLFLLIALSEQPNSIGAKILEEQHLSTTILVEHLPKAYQHSRTTPNTSVTSSILLWPEFSQKAKSIIEHAVAIAFEFRHHYIGTEHLLLALIQKPDAAVSQLFKKKNISTDTVKQKLLQTLNGTSKFSEIQSIFAQSPQTEEGADATAVALEDQIPQPTSSTPALDYFGVDLTQDEHIQKIDPVIGREKEIERIVHILARRTKNNPLLIGDPGVGKTAIVEGLARRINEQHVPAILLDKRIIALDLTLLIAGTMYRGEFEARLKQIIEEAKSNPNVILFIDEIHTIVGAGGVNGSTLDAANILKPPLARGELHCIGATTIEEYRKHIESDSALARRFQQINVDEPSTEEAVKIVKGVAKYYEQFHHVHIPQDVIQSAVQWSARFLPEQRLPDKAIDLLDEAAAKIRTKTPLSPTVKKLHIATRKLQQLQKKKEHAVTQEKFNLAVDLKKKEHLLKEKITILQKQVRGLSHKNPALTQYDIAEIISSISTVPLQQILSTQPTEMSRIEKSLSKYVIGQEEAIRVVSAALKRSYSGLARPKKPLGSFLFLGPSGVGKTELAKILAEHVFGDAEALIRVDMSEFSESFTISKLIGAPAGYVGYNDTIQFTDQIRRRPYSVVLFDEIEKAHPDIFNILLQVLDEGQLTDSSGRILHFRNSIIILTSNIGIDALNRQAEIGFSAEDSTQKTAESEFNATAKTILEELPEHFPQEFLNRIDHHVVFHPLSEKNMERIVELNFAHVIARLQEHNIQIHIEGSAKQYLAKKSFEASQGARKVERVIMEEIENPLSDSLLDGKLISGDTIAISAKNDTLYFVKKKKISKKK